VLLARTFEKAAQVVRVFEMIVPVTSTGTFEKYCSRPLLLFAFQVEAIVPVTSTGIFGRTADIWTGTIEKTSVAEMTSLFTAAPVETFEKISVVLVKSSLTWFVAECNTSTNMTSFPAETYVEAVPVLAGPFE